MALTYSTMLPLGTKLPQFKLTNTINDELFEFNPISSKKGKLVMFICNHCPFVIHNHQQISEVSSKYQNQIEFIAISSNDIETYPEDSPEKMQDLAKGNSWSFPYLYDESQEVAKSFDAQCTPEFYLFDEADKLVYRGRIDDSSPTNKNPSTGKDLRLAIESLLANEAIFDQQYPSVGCNIKWK